MYKTKKIIPVIIYHDGFSWLTFQDAALLTYTKEEYIITKKSAQELITTLEHFIKKG